MAGPYSFNEESINAALEAVQRHDRVNLTASSSDIDLAGGGDFVVRAQCISVTVQDGKVCLDLPLGFGHYCLPIPLPVPSGTAAQACLDICTTWGLPTGIKVTVSVAGSVVVQKTFGKC